MLEENMQCVASSLRNAILNFDMIPKVVYQDNGRAFRAKYFNDDKGFEELGFQGLYGKLGIQTIFAKPYNARAKVIERFFKEFQEGFEKLLPSYIGSSIIEKPAYLMRNEKLHKYNHNEYIPTFEEARKMIDKWLNFKNSQLCSNAPNQTIAEVLDARKRQNIAPSILDDLMLKTEVKTIQRNGIRFLGCDYFDERLYGLKSKCLIKYSLFNLTSIKVFTIKGEFLCDAQCVDETHPMASILGDVQDLEDFKQRIEKQKKLKRKTLNAVKKYLSMEQMNFLECLPEFISEYDQPTKEGEMLKQVQHDRLVNGKPIFKNNLEKYEWLIKHQPQNEWLQEFKTTKEYQIYFGVKIEKSFCPHKKCEKFYRFS